MNLVFLGAAHEVTGSCSLLNICGKKILVDCGMEQGADIYENCELPVAPGEIDAVLLTHAHIDHSGKLPALVAAGYRGPIYTTDATYQLCRIMLRDSAHIQESEAEWRNRKAQRSGGELYTPLYTIEDAENTLTLFKPQYYNQPTTIFEGITATFLDAGHLLGSSSILLNFTEEDSTRSILFSGDLGNIDRPLINDPALPTEHADFVVIESTYGDRTHGPRPDYIGQLTSILQETLDRGGNLVIPCFAVGRTQEMLYLLREIKEQGLIKGHDHFPVYVDSPLAVEATNIYAGDMIPFYDNETLQLRKQGIDPIRFKDLQLSVTSEESKAINFDTTPKVILSASGMCEAGRIRHHLKHNLWRPESTVLFVGYQSEGTIGRKLIEGVDEVKLFGETIAVACHIVTLDGISGHADKNMLLNWLSHLPDAPKRVFVNHGEDSVCDDFATAIQQQLNFDATAPYSGDQYDLISGDLIHKQPIVRATAKSAGAVRNETVYNRLLAAANRLLSIAKSAKGAPNKDIAKMADQINDLCNKIQ